MELATVVFALDICKHFLYGVFSHLFANHIAQKDLNSRERRWLAFLTDYDIDIVYHLDKANV